jgi:hypothetical protein
MTDTEFAEAVDRMRAHMAASEARSAERRARMAESVRWHFAGMDFDAATKTWHCKPGHWDAVQARAKESVLVARRRDGV